MRKHLIAAAALAALIPSASAANTAAAPAANAAAPAANVADPAAADPAANAALAPTAATPVPTEASDPGEGRIDLSLGETQTRRQKRDGFPWGLLGLIGLAGLIPIKRKGRDEA